MNYKLERAKIEDLQEIILVVKSAKQYLKECAVDQWQDGFPSKEQLTEDILLRESYKILINGEIAGFFLVDCCHEPEYSTIVGKWLSNDDYATLHRTAIKKEYRGIGLSKIMFDKVLQYAKEKNLKSMRVDTHKDNNVMNGLAKKHGFTFCGVVTLPSGAKRNAYEKMINYEN